MMRKIILITLFLEFVSGTVQGKKDVIVNLELVNATSVSLTKVILEWKGPYVPGGVMSPGVSKESLDVVWPFIPDGKVDFYESDNGKHHQITASFSEINKSIVAGGYRSVQIRIVGLDEVKIVGIPVKEKSK